MNKLYTIKRTLLSKDKKNIVILRYGNLEDQSRYKMSIADVSRKLSINYWTVYSVLHRFKLHGPIIFEKAAPKKLRSLIGSTEVEQLILSDKYLYRWGSLNM